MVSSGAPVDSDVEVHPYGEALLPVVIILVSTQGALQADFFLDVLPEGFFVKKFVYLPSTKDMTALLT